MKSILSHILVVASIIFLMMTSSDTNVIAGELITMSQYEVQPYMEKKLPDGGPFTQFIKGLFESMGHEVKIDWFPHKRAYMNVKKGQWDCSAGWNKLPEREGKVLFSDTIMYETLYLYHLKSNKIQWESIEDLNPHRIGVKLGAAVYGDDFFNAAKTNKIIIDYALTDLLNLKKLFAKRIDIVPLSKINAGYFLKKNFSKEKVDLVTYHPKPFSKTSFHLIFSLKNKPLMNAFNAAFLKAGGQQFFKEKMQKMHQSVYKNKKTGLNQ